MDAGGAAFAAPSFGNAFTGRAGVVTPFPPFDFGGAFGGGIGFQRAFGVMSGA